MIKEFTDRSYRALFAVPSMTRLLFGMQIARIGQAMVSVALVLFTLDSYRSVALAGMVTFCAIFPGLVVSPIAGALLDRHGRRRLVVLDYLVALGSLALMGILALMGMLPAWLLLAIASVASLTAPLSATGLRSLFPLIVPHHLWERVNAVDSTGYVIAAVVGPPLAAGLVAIWGGAVSFIIIGAIFGLAAIVISQAPDPPSQTSTPGPLLVEAWDGLVYTWRNPTLRGLGFSISVQNLVNGLLTILVPLLVLERFHLDKAIVGLVFGIQGLTGMFSAVFFGRTDSRNRERTMLAIPMIATGFVLGGLLLQMNLAMLLFVMAAIGFLNGPLDVALFTLRQRRTDPAWTGRAFAISMSFNYVGTPIGSAVAGIMAARSIKTAIVGGVLTSIISGVLAVVMVPSTQ